VDYRFKHPLYTDDDKDLAIAHLADYINNNNIPEHYATSDGPFEPSKSVTPIEFLRPVIERQYGVNITNIANILMMQDLFFEKYMPHLSRYLDLVGVKHYFSYIRPSSITSRYILRMYLSGKVPNIPQCWNSDVLWLDYSYKKNDYNANIHNPINNFYSASLILFDINNDAFRDALDKFYDKDTRDNRGKPCTIGIRILPSLDPSFMINITKLIHKYF